MDAPNEMSIKELITKLKEWWRYLLNKSVIIVIAGIIGGSLGVVYAFYKKPIYKAELTFALEDDKAGGSLGGALGLASQFGLDIGGSGGGAFSGDNLLQLMKSRSLVEKTLLTSIDLSGKKQTLAELYIDFNGLRKKWKKEPGLENVKFLPGADRSKFTLKQDSVLKSFHELLITKNLSVDKLDKRLTIIAVRMQSENELFSKYFTEILTKEVSDFYIKTKTAKSSQNVAILVHQTDSIKKQLNLAISGVVSSIDATPNPNPNRQLLKAPSQRKQVDVQVNQAILEQLVPNLEISKVALRKETPLIQIIDLPNLPLEKVKLSKKVALIEGAFLTSFIVILYLVIKKILQDL